jgi:hypothetical protein
VRILRGPTVLATVDVPYHGWFSRWRWQSAPRPVRAKSSQLMDQWLAPQLSERAHPSTPAYRTAARYTPMGLADLSAAMGATGERPEIGMVTEAQAQYLCNGNDAALALLLAQAESAGTYGFTVRDEKTGAPIDVLAYPHASLYSPEGGNPYIRSIGSAAHPDHAHQPALSYIPYLLTGDPYHLEQLQLMATWNVIWRPWQYRYRTTQVRGEAWSLRTWAQVAKVTPAAVPKWLLPQSHWQKLLDSYLNNVLTKFVHNTEPPRAIFRTIEEEFGDNRDGLLGGTYTSPWMDEFYTSVVGWMVLMGHTSWRPVFEWKIGSAIARTNGQSGWPRSFCTTYRIIMRANSATPWATNWKEAWDLTAAGLKLTLEDPDVLSFKTLYTLPYTRGSLILGKHLQIPNVDPCIEWAERETGRASANRKGLPYRWALI